MSTRIAHVKTYALRAEVPTPFYFAQRGIVRHRSSLVVEVITEDGISGFGEALCNGHQPAEIAQATIDASLRDLLTGRDALETSVLYEESYNLTKDFGMKGAVMGAISAVDIALWDLKGKILGQPVHVLLGGAFRTSLAPYATGFYRVEGGDYPRLLAEEAQRHLDAGFTAMKVKIGFGIESDVRSIAAVRDVVGPSVRIMADANHAYNAGDARRLVRELDELGVYWLEEPISPEDVDGYKSLVAMSPKLLLAAGENEFSRHGFWPWVTGRAVDVLQPDLAAAGGFTGLSQIQSLTLAAGLTLNPHVWGTSIGLSAAIQFLAAIPPVPMSRVGHEPLLEFDQSSHPFRRELIEEEFELVDGRVPVPTRPGLGITVNRAVLERFGKSTG
jgi:D-galactarolactone cycloisomerase